MRIADLRRTSADGAVRVSAHVEWEDADRAGREIFFELPEPSGREMVASPEAFLTAAVVPAAWHQERRVRIEGSVCPELREGLRGTLAVLGTWNRRFGPVEIEATEGFRPPARGPERTAACFSGGVDSLFTIRRNLLEIPREHPAAIVDGILIAGHDAGAPGASAAELDRHAARVAALTRLAASAGIEILPMRFNVRELDDDLDLYIDAFFGAALASAGHALVPRISRLRIPSSYDLGHLVPCGSHPLLDPNFGSAALEIRHDGASRTRLEKLEVVVGWPEALAVLQTCNVRPVPEGRLNCGVCEKCLRTALGLLALGRLGDAPTFRASDVTPEAIRALGWSRSDEVLWGELVEPLRRAGQGNLARAAEEKTRAARRFREWREEADGRGIVKRVDRRYFAGRLAAVARKLRRRNTR